MSSRIGENLEQSLPNLRELILTSNNIQELVSGAGATPSGVGYLHQGGLIVCVRPLRSTTTRSHCLNQLCSKYLFKLCSFESIEVNKHTSLSGDPLDPTI